MLSVDSQPLTNLTDRLRNLQHEGYSPNTGQYIWMYGKFTQENIYNRPIVYMQGISMEGLWFSFAESQFCPQLQLVKF